METDVTFRFANSEDLETILIFQGTCQIRKLENEVIATPELLNEWIFERGRAEVIFALANGKNGVLLCSFTTSLHPLGRAGIYLEDLFRETRISRRGIRGKPF